MKKMFAATVISLLMLVGIFASVITYASTARFTYPQYTLRRDGDIFNKDGDEEIFVTDVSCIKLPVKAAYVVDNYTRGYNYVRYRVYHSIWLFADDLECSYDKNMPVANKVYNHYLYSKSGYAGWAYITADNDFVQDFYVKRTATARYVAVNATCYYPY